MQTKWHYIALAWSSLVQAVVWHLFETKLIPELMLIYCQLDIQEDICSEMLFMIQTLLFKEMHMKFSTTK